MTASAAALALSGCMPTTALPPSTEPPARASNATPLPPSPSAESQKLATYYSRVQKGLLAQGLLRTDGGGEDTPYTAAQLAENFRKIALFEEYTNVGGQIVARPRASKLHKWDQPIRVGLTFGDGVLPDQQGRDRRAIDDYVDKLAGATGHPIEVAFEEPNFHVFVVDEASRKELGPELERIIPTIDKAAMDTVVNLPRSSYCLVVGYDPDDDGTYSTAVAVIRAEHPDLLRLSCIHEELAQGLGLSNDSPAARPSVFNDDEEFALLTRMDEDLLRILYDPRLEPGMTADQAMPIVRQIAEERLDE
ncbi:MAG: DUF2927 domain-containing protein [Pseudomonadota bacterium]